jgi:hypothetical protein
MKKIIVSVVLASVVSFAGSFKLENIYFNEDGTYYSSTKVYNNTPSNNKLIAFHEKKYNAIQAKLKKTKSKILASN